MTLCFDALPFLPNLEMPEIGKITKTPKKVLIPMRTNYAIWKHPEQMMKNEGCGMRDEG
jgi:hypothetical protein